MASRDIKDLNKETDLLAQQFLTECAKQSIAILIYCTYRSPKEQDELYSIGRTKPGVVVTNAKGGESYHQYRCAFDFVPLIGGKPQWNNDQLYAKAGTIAESVGLEWSGRWKGKLKETAHCQFTGGKTLSQLKQSYGESILVLTKLMVDGRVSLPAKL